MQEDQFFAFYEIDPRVNSLENNPDGEVMARLLQKAKPQIKNIWKRRDPKGYNAYQELKLDSETNRCLLGKDKGEEIFKRVCALASACVASKCWFGGLGNSVCQACVGVVIVCAIYEAVS